MARRSTKPRTTRRAARPPAPGKLIYDPDVGMEMKALPYRGRWHPVVATEGKPFFDLIDGKFVVRMTRGGNWRDKIRTAHTEWLTKRARSYLPARVSNLGDRHGIWPKKVVIKEEERVWGGTTPDGTVSLNPKVLMLPTRLINYVILHELCHILHPNHSKRFWSMLSSIFPRVAAAKREMGIYADAL